MQLVVIVNPQLLLFTPLAATSQPDLHSLSWSSSMLTVVTAWPMGGYCFIDFFVEGLPSTHGPMLIKPIERIRNSIKSITTPFLV